METGVELICSYNQALCAPYIHLLLFPPHAAAHPAEQLRSNISWARDGNNGLHSSISFFFLFFSFSIFESDIDYLWSGFVQSRLVGCYLVVCSISSERLVGSLSIPIECVLRRVQHTTTKGVTIFGTSYTHFYWGRKRGRETAWLHGSHIICLSASLFSSDSRVLLAKERESTNQSVPTTHTHTHS